MNIGYFTNEFPNRSPETLHETGRHYGGGVGAVVFDLAIQMANRGHEVHIFSTSPTGEEYTERYGRIHIYRYKPNFSIGSASISLRHLSNPFFTKIKLDIAHSHVGNLPAPIEGLIYSKLNQIPFVITQHGDWLGGHGSISRRACVFAYNNLLCNILFSMSDRIISLSDSHLANSRWLKNYQKKVVIIPNGVNLKEFQGANSKAQSRALLGLPTDKKIILFLGSLTARKGSQILVNAMNKVIAKSPNTVLVIVGDGSQKSKLQESINRLELNNAVILTGSVSENQKIAYYRSADIFTLPSFAEAFPLSLLEAGAAGLPVIATRVGGIPNIVEDGANGLLIEAGNCDDLADKISYLLDDGTLRETMGSTGRKMAAQYSWEAISDKTELLYFDILNRARLKKTLPTVP